MPRGYYERRSADLRFEDRVIRWGAQPGECWGWDGSHYPSGYPQFSPHDGKSVVAHRFGYEHWVGPIPKGLQLDHLCRNPWCVNPQHLEAVTAQENILRSEGVAAINARKTHCIRGHPLSGYNMYLDQGKRQCRACRSMREKAVRDALDAVPYETPKAKRKKAKKK